MPLSQPTATSLRGARRLQRRRSHDQRRRRGYHREAPSDGLTFRRPSAVLESVRWRVKPRPAEARPFRSPKPEIPENDGENVGPGGRDLVRGRRRGAGGDKIRPTPPNPLRGSWVRRKGTPRSDYEGNFLSRLANGDPVRSLGRSAAGRGRPAAGRPPFARRGDPSNRLSNHDMYLSRKGSGSGSARSSSSAWRSRS